MKISSTRTLQPESGNGEGLKNYHLGDGVNLILRSGNEYDDIMPVWNWRKLPGTTTEQGTYSLKPTADWGVAGTSTYAGGISDGTYAGTTFRYNRRNVAAKKAWFFFDDAFVALGTDIDAPAATAQVETTLNQSLRNGMVTYSTGGTPQTLASGTTTLGGLQWVHHDGTGYFFNEVPASASIQAAAQSGTWQSINTGYDTTSVSKDVFALSIRHGTAFSNGSYAYTVAPGLNAGEMVAWTNPIAVLRNDATAQAARDASVDVTQAAFHSAGSVDLGAGASIAADSACMVMLRPEAEGLRVSASSPEAKTMTAGLQFTGIGLGGGWMNGFGTGSVSIGLPSGDLAGSTAGLRMWRDGAANPTLNFAGMGGSTSLAASFGALALNGDTTLVVDGMTLSFSGAISGGHSLAKAGSGKLILSGDQTRTGATHVKAGILEISSASLANQADVEISAGAVLALVHSAVDTIAALSFDGMVQAQGLWGAPGSGAAHESARLAGTGRLLVTVHPFEHWLDGYPALTDPSEDGDPDGDRWPNLIEYALGTDPLLADPPAAVRREGNMLVLEFQRAGLGAGVRLMPEWSDDLLEWSEEGITLDDSAAPLVRAKLVIDGGQKFLRLRALRE